MNNVVLKGKLGAGFIDDRYTLPKDGNPGDILVKTETGSEWQKQEPAETLPTDGNPGDILVKTETGSAWQKQQEGGGGRFIVNAQQVEHNGRKRIMLDKTVRQIYEAYNSGKTVMLNAGGNGPGEILTLTYNSSSFYGIIPAEYGTSGISKIAIIIVGNPTRPGVDWTQSDVLWDFVQLTLQVGG